MSSPYDFEAMAATLETSGEYRVARRLKPRLPIAPTSAKPCRLGLVVDVETTGLDPTRDEIIELAMTPFSYTTYSTILSIGESFHGLRESSVAIPSRITEITGITDEIVAGHEIDPEDVARFVAPASLVIAHNAAFDRRFLERFSDVFSTKPWACSLTQIDWASEGFECASSLISSRHRASSMTVTERKTIVSRRSSCWQARCHAQE